MEKQKKELKGVWQLYSVKENKLERLRNSCPKCGPGTFMANHEDRLTCGKCGYTIYKNKKK
ncbi:MAG: 30S ribosomal protein S27ae [Candidatus Rehaiarchaeum fermentans]|nr:30S ribosomal protein S27ae [Candidatus Rehaiarchaeum fermentans]MCW1292691.1 30S ribosomal protein S27ae [Candidatus Rehaiarchaeum fermentans]MCW1293293.1 30S ribosomal protein S27ae [Candidatus Rehaiarchaeum fermentans]MCW1293593.1 30S ribosomal protein S27ae [Candidatus Rehaiarchaeum fermentans]MCW1297595.1 30S ribosomal protein S27ae [Candidatus Rehaiarchaeum fermentans]